MLTLNNPVVMEARPRDQSPGVRLGKWVRERRQALGLTQEQLAERMEIEVDRNWMTQLEGGRRKGLPDFDLLNGLSVALRVPVTDVLQAAGVMPIDVDRIETEADVEVERLVALVRTVHWTPERLQYVGDLLRSMVRFG